MDLKTRLSKLLFILTPEEKLRFDAYLPGKVYTTERTMSVVVAATQVCMILLFFAGGRLSHPNPRTLAYFALYLFLLTTTICSFFLYSTTYRRQRYQTLLWLRRGYALCLGFWVLGITCLEIVAGNGLSVYCYLLPTTAAVLMLTPVESLVTFGATWAGLFFLLLTISANQRDVFSELVNSAFVTILTLFISFRYYSSMAKEFLDRETIAQQYEAIKQSNTLLEKLAYLDQLTGLYNRHFLHETVYPQAACHIGSEDHTMCLMMDIDYFKQYNDLYGHLQGDICLKRLAEVIRLHCGEGQVAAIRYGGEEFLLLKTGPAPFDHQAFAQTLQEKMKEAELPRSDVPQQRVTVSIGLWYGVLSESLDLNAAIQRADDALYQAKSLGRDRVELSA